MADRRSFLRSLVAAGAALALNPAELLASRRNFFPLYFGVHSFVESHPDAVFIMRTNVDVKTNSAAKLQAGLAFGSSVFVPLDSPGIPITHRVAIKPNIVYMPAAEEQYMGIVTDAYFVEGVIQSLKLLGFVGGQFYLREVNYPSQFANSGYLQMAERTGADLRALNQPVGTIPESDLQWIDVPQGKWFKRIPFLWPVNAPDTWLLNIAKFKTHLMGMSLCAKNLQGAIAIPYVAHCTQYNATWNIDPDDVQPDAKAHIWEDYQRHLAAGIPRWDRPGEDGGIWQEIWAARCLDNNSVTHPGLHIIEGIYGREGPFEYGPGPDGEGVDYMTNVIIFGKNPFHVDNIGLWLGGHEPGNFGLLHMAIERGQATILNPHDIPVYEWHGDGSASATSLESFTRASLRTQYLRRDYNGQQEADWHLVNEPYVYSTTIVNGKALLEGPYSAGTMSTALRMGGYVPLTQPYTGAPWNYAGTESVVSIPSGVVDWVLLELRTGTASSTKAATRAAFIKSDGSVTDIDGTSPVAFPSVTAGDYYVVVRHRNHLAVMSHDAVALSGTSTLYDFTTGLVKYYGGEAAALSGGKYGLFAGDVTGDGAVVLSDELTVIRANNLQEGYNKADVNMDGGVVLSDELTIVRANNLRGTNVP